MMSPGNQHRFGCRLGHLSPVIARTSKNNPTIADGKSLQDLIGVHQT